MRRLVFLVMIIFPAIRIAAQHRLEKLNIYFNKIALKEAVNGNVLLAERGRIIYNRSFGYADFRSGRKNYANTHFNLASVSKVFTSTAIIQLKEKGRLKLDDAFKKYFKDFPYPQVTIRHLLTHTSGLPDLELYENLIKQFPDTVVHNDIIIPTLIKEKMPLYFNPGDKFSYCNTNYGLLALLVEKLSGQSFGNYLADHIFGPAKMSDTYLPASSYRLADSTIAVAHTRVRLFDTAYVPAYEVDRYRYTEYNNSAAAGASDIITTTADLLKFDDAFFSCRLLSKASVEEALTPVKLNDGKDLEDHMDTMEGEGRGSYGLGWELFDQPGIGKSAGHGGFKRGLATFYCRNLESGKTVIAFDNTAGRAFGKVITSSLNLLHNYAPVADNAKESLTEVYAQAMIHGGTENAVICFNTLKDDTTHYYLSEQEMNRLGYEFLYFSTLKDCKTYAIETFKINTLLFPRSYNTYDSYAEALANTGRKQEALLMYQKSLDLNPENKEGRMAMEKIMMELK